MIIITTNVFIFYILSSFILGLIIMALSYELYLCLKKRKKNNQVLPITLYVKNPIKTANNFDKI